MENEQVKQVERETIKLEEPRKQPSNLEGPGGVKRGAAQGLRLVKLLGLL